MAAVLVVLVAGTLACNGANCTRPGDCNLDGGELCLYPAGAGCVTQGHCEKQKSCTVTAGQPSVFCTCEAGVSINLACVPSNGIPDRTTSGVCRAPDAGSD